MGWVPSDSDIDVPGNKLQKYYPKPCNHPLDNEELVLWEADQLESNELKLTVMYNTLSIAFLIHQ